MIWAVQRQFPGRANVSSIRHLLLLTGLCAASWGLAQDTTCQQTQSSEGKISCLDNLAKQQSHCFSIQDTDSKNLCMAQLRQQKSYCFSIRSADLKTICFDAVK